MKYQVALIAASAAMAAASPAATNNTRRSNSKTPPVTVKGNAFFAGDERFYIRGIDYQPGGSSKAEDPIAEPNICKRDIKYFKELGINTVRIYTVDNSADHDECMDALADAGIYLALDANTPKYSLNRKTPKPSYNDVYLQSIFATIDMFQKYDNTLLFFSGNEVINDDESSSCAPYIKAVTRDMKQYIGERGYRQIPVGYSAADVESNRFETAQYMNCGTDDERSDFFAFNDYSWCDPSDFQTSGWDKKVEQYKDYGIPLFLSEFGCNTNKREFNEIESIYGKDMAAVYSGGLVYEYSEEGSKYGLVKVKDESTVEETDDFKTLKSKLEKTSSPDGDGGYSKEGKASKCPSKSKTWNIDPEAGLPAIPEPAKKYMKSGAGDGPGLKGSGSQWAGTQSSGTATAGSGTVSSTGGASSSESSGSAASSVRVSDLSFTPIICIGAVMASTLFGATLL